MISSWTISERDYEQIEETVQHKNEPYFNSPMGNQLVYIENNNVGATNGAGTGYPSGAHEFIHGFSGVRLA